jgi:hypothetical protein
MTCGSSRTWLSPGKMPNSSAKLNTFKRSVLAF